MELSAVLLARVIYFVESADLNPRGAAYYPDIVAAMVQRYKFQTYPQKVEDFNEQKGVVLAEGKLGDKVVEKVVVYNWGITLETTSSTRDSEELLEEALAWATANLKLTYKPEMVKRKAYVSQVTFFSEAPILSLNPVLGTIANKLSETVSANMNLPNVFHPLGVFLNIDATAQPTPVQVFSIERRQNIPFSDGKYFSSAPVPTDAHIELIKEFERAVQQPKVGRLKDIA